LQPALIVDRPRFGRREQSIFNTAAEQNYKRSVHRFSRRPARELADNVGATLQRRGDLPRRAGSFLEGFRIVAPKHRAGCAPDLDHEIMRETIACFSPVFVAIGRVLASAVIAIS
jgi:hypothetical protein